MTATTNIILTAACAIGGGTLLERLKVPCGALIGAMLAVVLYQVFREVDLRIPAKASFAVQVLVGGYVGLTFKPEMIVQIKAMLGPMVISAFSLMTMGLIIAMVLVRLGLVNIDDAFLCTNPGAMIAMTGMGTGLDSNIPLVMSFHFMRLFLVIATAPLLLRFITWFKSAYG